MRKIISTLSRWHIYRKTCNTLRSLNDNELRDIGVDRCNIMCVAREVSKIKGR